MAELGHCSLPVWAQGGHHNDVCLQGYFSSAEMSYSRTVTSLVGIDAALITKGNSHIGKMTHPWL
jgi:hypothetical protein